MAFLFKKGAKTPAELVRAARDALTRLDVSDKKKNLEEISQLLAKMKGILYGENDAEPSQEVVAQLAQEVYTAALIPLLISNLAKLEFEAKKDVVQVLNNLLRRQVGARYPTVDYILSSPDMFFTLVEGYENQEIALNCGMILREALRHEQLTALLLGDEVFWKFFRYVELSTFDVASDAFATFRDILIKHKQTVADFLGKNYDRFFESYTILLNSDNYVTKRQSLKLLGEILLDRSNYSVMTTYIGNPDNLKLMMNLLRDKSKNIQFEAFHVFKVFVANPNKPRPVYEILDKNKEKLLGFLATFHTERSDDEQFTEEKEFLIRQIKDL